MRNFTLIIPTHNRHNYIKRSIAYFKDLDAKVIYCDSSDEKYTDYLPPNVLYIHLPKKKFAEKILVGLENSDADFVALCADDDFIMMDALYSGLSVLEKDNQFVAVVGRYAFFNDPYDGVYYNKSLNLPNDISGTSIENIEMFFKNYYQILWALYRKEYVNKAFNIINNSGLKNDNFIEYILGSVLCYHGGIKFIDLLWGVRERTQNDHWGKRHIGLPNVTEKELEDDIERISNFLDRDTFNGLTRRGLDIYIQAHREKSRKNKILNIGISIIPIFMKSPLRLILSKLNKKRQTKQLCDTDSKKLHPISEILTKLY